MNNNLVLELRDVSKVIGQQRIVDKLSFKVNKGEIVGLLGPNGAGKTTTIRMIVGLINMSEGDILINGHSVKTHFTAAIEKLGAIVENPEFYGYMTGIDNLKQYQRMSKGITDERIEEVVKIVGLTNAMNKKVKTYSLGMRQRLGIAQALLHNPDVLILDEPTNGLDPAGIREMRDYLKKIAEVDNIAVLVSSHLLTEMELMCSRVVVIQQGKFIQEQQLTQKGSEKQVVSLRVSQVALARTIINEIEGISIKGESEQNNTIVIELLDEQVPAVIKQLVNRNIDVYRIESTKGTLEDEFLKWTGGNQIV